VDVKHSVFILSRGKNGPEWTSSVDWAAHRQPGLEGLDICVSQGVWILDGRLFQIGQSRPDVTIEPAILGVFDVEDLSHRKVMERVADQVREGMEKLGASRMLALPSKFFGSRLAQGG